MTIVPRAEPAEEMSVRAQSYLLWGFGRHAATGAFMVWSADQFVNAQFLPIISYFTIPVWGWLCIIVGLICLIGTVLRNRDVARLGLMLSACITAALTTGLWLGAIDIWMAGGKTTPILAIALTSLVGKDLSVCTNPMRTPFELDEVVKRLKAGGRRG
jgi:hypothetical protein